MKKLLCHTTLLGNFEDYILIEKREYDIISENADEYKIIDEKCHEHFFTKKPDDEGLSFVNWFDLIK